MDLLSTPTSRMTKTGTTWAIYAGTTLLNGGYTSWKLAACYLPGFRKDDPTARIVEMATYEYERLS